MSSVFEPYLGRWATGVPSSNSEIQTFKENRREWWLRYYLGRAPKETKMVGPLPLGTRIHLALEMLYKEGADPVAVYLQQLEEDRELFLQSRDALDDKMVSKFNSDAELGRIMVEGYLEWLEETNIDAGIHVIDVEKELTYPLYDGRVILRGKIDMKVQDSVSGFTLLMDHKTAINFSQYHKIAHMSEQLMTYTMLEKLQGADTPIEGGMYNLLKKVKRTAKATPPFYERIVVRF